MSNYHIHMIFAERKLLDKPVEKVATRNMFFNEKGKHVRTKKEILDIEGRIRKGCKIIPKGEVYEKHLFEPKIDLFKEKQYLNEAKQKITNLINQYVPEEDKKLAVFDKSSPYLPTKKIGKNNPKAQQIKHDNTVRNRWNQAVDEALLTGIEEKEIQAVKVEQINKKVEQSIKVMGSFPYLFQEVVESAMLFLKKMIEKFLLSPKPVFHGNMEKYELMEVQRQEFMALVQKIKRIDEKEIQPLKTHFNSLNPIFKARERKALEKKINIAILNKHNLEVELEAKIEKAGYKNIREFMEAYHKIAYEVSEYQSKMEDWKYECQELEIQKSYEESKKNNQMDDWKDHKRKG